MTAPKRPALDEAVDILTSVRNASGPYKTSPRDELEALLERPELLRRMADERLMNGDSARENYCGTCHGRCVLEDPR